MPTKVNFNYIQISSLSKIKLVYWKVFKNLYTFRKGLLGKSTSSGMYLRRSAPKLICKRFFFNNLFPLITLQSTLMFSISIYRQPNTLIGFFQNSENVLVTLRYNTLTLFTYSFNDELGYFPAFNTLNSYKYLGNLSINDFITSLTPLFDVSIRYVRSYGSKAKIYSFNSTLGTYAILLPSGSLKIFFILTKVIEFSMLKFYQNKKNFKAGYTVNLGFRPKVRGVAMNPVDHPHGGRTKSIKLPRTPWGFVTKRK